MKKIVLFVILSFFGTLAVGQTELAGVINSYAKVDALDVCKNLMVVDDAGNFSEGDFILIYQAKGAAINASNNSNFGQITDIGAAGLYEINQIQSISGRTITLSFALANKTYNHQTGKIQIVSLPNYTDAVVKDQVTSLPWDGNKGGIVAIEVTNTLTLEADIVVSGQGFRGGVSEIDERNNCNFLPRSGYYYGLNDWRGSTKGEGIAQAISGREAGRGPQATGGGGGNDHNTGGGGGSNLARGGNGSISIAGCSGRLPGLGGNAVNTTNAHLFLGGGGGAGHENNDLGTDGAHGGGLVFIIARNVQSSGGVIRADGNSASLVRGDGGGGGGAGGTIFLDVENVNGPLEVSAIGGNGGDQNARNRDNCMGVGGGGSGGALYLTNAVGVQSILNGGFSGELTNCNQGSFSGEDGLAGQTRNNVELVRATIIYEPLGVVSPTIVEVCSGKEAIIEPAITGDAVGYQWQVNEGQGFVDLSDGDGISGSNTQTLRVQEANAIFRYRLIVTGSCGETKSSAAIRLQPQAGPNARFNLEVDVLSVDFINTTSKGVDYLWEFGDGTTSTDVNPSHVYEEPGIYTITLTAENACDNDQATQTIEVFPLLFASFSAEPLIGCTPLTTQFFNRSSEDSQIIEWSFPGGTPMNSTEVNPTVTYANPGFYSVSLIVTDGMDLDTLTRDSFITVIDEPDVRFQTTQEGVTVQFTRLNPGVGQVAWDFGDGNTSMEANPLHTYATDGTYLVTLTVTNDCASSVGTNNVTVLTSPVAEFSLAPSGGCTPLNIQFSDSSTGAISERQWSFPGGTPNQSTASNPVVTYEEAGTYSARLIVSNDFEADTFDVNGIEVQPGTQADFQFQINEREVFFNNTSSNADQFIWEFGDGNGSTAVTPNHTYDSGGNYRVQLISINSCSRDTITKELLIVEDPVAGFEFITVENCTPGVVQFSDLSTGTVTTWEWSFPNGEPAISSAQNPLVRYPAAGNFSAQLIAGNELKQDTFILDGIVIQESTQADFGFQVTELVVQFSNQSVNSDSFLWEFGDGTTSMEENPIHTYAMGGTFDVRLISINSCSQDTLVQSIRLLEAPDASFTFDPSSGCSPLSIQYNSTAVGSIDQFQWFFPGGIPESSTEESPVVLYANPGNYTATLIVENQIASDTFMQTEILIEPPAQSRFDFTFDALVVDFNNLSTNATDFEWDFGDGLTSTDPNPQHTYPTTGSYTIQLIVSNFCSSDTTQQVVELFERPIAAFSIEDRNLCSPASVQFNNESSGSINNVQWFFQGGNPSSSKLDDPVIVYSDPGNYSATLIVENDFISDTITIDNITILETVNASFTFVTNELEVAFESQSNNADAFVWDFGDSTGSMEANPIHIYEGAGEYVTRLITSNTCSRDTFTQTIRVLERPLALARIDQDRGCNPLQIQFTNESQGTIESVQWLFPGGEPNASQEMNPLVAYNTPGLYVAQLIVGNELGVDSIAIENIEVIEVVKSSFTTDVRELEVQFNLNTNNGIDFAWDFGDGSTSLDSNPLHLYSEAGEYLVRLISSNFCSSDTVFQRVKVSEFPVAAFSMDVEEGCSPLQIQFNNESQGTIETVQWLFPGGTPVETDQENPVVTYSEAGNYTAVLIVGNELGVDSFQFDQIRVIEPVNSDFTFTADELAVSFNVQSNNGTSFQWNFGDGGSSNEQNPDYVYSTDGTFQVQLISDNGCSQDTTLKELKLFRALTAQFSSDVSSGCNPLEVQFFNQSTGTPGTVFWEFPGGVPATSTDANPRVQFPNPGTFDVQLMVQNDLYSDTTQVTDFVVVNESVVSRFEVEVDELMVSFNQPLNSGNSYQWDFGDGNTSELENPIHQYDTSGNYTVRLVSSNICSSDTLEQEIVVKKSLRPLFQSNKLGGCAPASIQFRDMSTGQPTSWMWEFPGGVPANSNDSVPIVQYDTPGVYEVKLTVSNESETQSILVEDAILIRTLPEPAFDFTLTENTIQFINLSEGANAYIWTFGDGNRSNDVEPSHTFETDGNYTVTLNAQNEFCGQAVSQTISFVLSNVDVLSKNPNIRVYPNPANGYLKVEQAQKQSIVLRLMDLNGQVILQQTIQEEATELSLKGIPSGNYFLLIKDNTDSWIQKIVVQQ